MKFHSKSLFAFTLAALTCGARAEITFLSGVSLPNGGEIVSYSSGTVLTTNSLSASSHAVQMYSLGANGVLTAGTSVNLNGVYGAAATASVTSVLADSRGFGVATIVPSAKTATDFGRIAFFDLSTGTILNTLDVGYHPDSVTITPDGTKLLIANEGEYGSTDILTPEAVNRNGSVSVVDISSVLSTTNIAALSASNVSTYDFTAGNLDSGVTISGLRNARLDTVTVKSPNVADIEPEYITATNDLAYITLQENNAIATLDLTTGKYTAINTLGTIQQVIDASDRDGAGNTALANRNDTVTGLPMPDTITKFVRSGTTFLVTANEGDARPDDGDIFRASQQNTTVNGSLAPDIDSAVDGTVTNTGIARLNILKDQGDTDADGDIDVPTMMGTRSFSIWDAETGELAFDSDSMIEDYVISNDLSSHNINNGSLGNFDTRSDEKGPEPEALAFGSIDGRDFVFLGNERQNGIFQFDITDLNNVTIVGYFNPVTSALDSGGAFISPESIQFLSAASNPTGMDLLVVGFEGTGSNGSIATFQATVPEPGTATLLGLGALLLAARRSRRKLA